MGGVWCVCVCLYTSAFTLLHVVFSNILYLFNIHLFIILYVVLLLTPSFVYIRTFKRSWADAGIPNLFFSESIHKISAFTFRAFSKAFWNCSPCIGKSV